MGERSPDWRRMSSKNSKMKRPLVPRLRFPEFREAGEWETKLVREVFRVTRGEVLAMSLVKDKPDESYPYPVYSSQTKNNGLAGYYSQYLYENAITWTTDGANAGDVNFRDCKFFCTNVCGVLLNSDGWANRFSAALLNLVARNYVSYVGNPKLMNGVMSEISVPFPSLREQQKIADCLSSLDELNTLEAKKLEALKTHKKGLMQQLFPREGETVPRLRFPEFRDQGEWEEKALFEVCRITQGGTPDTTVDTFWGGPIQWITPAEMDKGDSKYITKTVRSITEEGLLNCSSELLPVNSVIISTRAPIGHLAINQEPMAINQGCRGLIPKPNFDTHFIYHSLDKSKMQLNDLGSGNTFKELSGGLLKKFSFAFPVLDEQQKIADCLSSLDDLITAQSQKVKLLKRHKKGLMQQLFPVLEVMA